MPVTYIKDSIFNHRDKFDAIAQGNNCLCTWGAGVALKLRDRLPKTFIADKGTRRADEKKLGTIVSAVEESGLIGICMYTQFAFGEQPKRVWENAFISCCRELKKKFPDKRIAMPRVGCTNAGQEWADVEEIILVELEGMDILIIDPGLPDEYNDDVSPTNNVF